MDFDWTKLATAGAGSGLTSVFGSNPSKDASKYLDQIPEAIRPYFQKYIDSGSGALSDLQVQYKDLLGDPGSILSRIGKGYKESPGFEFQKNQGLNSINNAAAAGGMLGSEQHQQQAGELSENIANKDYGDYMKNALGLYGRGLSGEEGLNSQGFDASTGYGRNLAEFLNKKGDYAYEEGAAKNKQWSDLLSMLIGGGAKSANL